MKSILLEVWVTINSKKEAKEIAHDLHEILNDSGITNSINITDKEAE